MSKMNEDDDQCVICLTPLRRTLHISTECNHRFHIECIRKNVENGNVNCPLCNRSFPTLVSYFNKDDQQLIKHSMATGKGDKDPEQFVKPTSSSASGYEDNNEWACENCTLWNKPTVSICEVCEYPRHSASASARETESQSQWSCSSCTYINMSSDKICVICGEGMRPTIPRILPTNGSKIPHRSPSQESFSSYRRPRSPSNDSTRHFTSETNLSQSTSRSSSSQIDTCHSSRESRNDLSASPSTIPKSAASTSHNHDLFTVYIPDLPADKSDTQLEQMIHDRLGNDSQITIVDVKCYARFSVGVLRVQSQVSKKHLLSDLQSIVLNPPYPAIISFTDTLELISYIVFDQNVVNIPTKDEVLQRWIQIYKGVRPEKCEPVSVLYPNIFRIASTSFDDLLQASTIQDFKVKNEFATVYFRADCSYFEDIPTMINRDDLFTGISNKIGLKTSAAATLYVQFNRDAKNAIILAAGPARKWINETFLYLGTQVLTKKVHMAYRLLLHPVPSNCPFQSILQHQHFENGIVQHHRKEESIILELNDQNLYERLINIGAVRIDDHRIFIDAYSALNDPEGTEITAENWYETRMLDYDPDIMPFILKKHPILRYSWNAKIWQEQFQKANSSNQPNQDQNRIRHLLRMTTMLNTIGVIRKKRYMLDDQRVVQLRDEPLKTIVYHHQSKLFSARKVSNLKDIRKFGSTTVEVVRHDCLHVYHQLASSGRRPVVPNMANQTSTGGGYRRGDGAQEENFFRRSNYCLSLDVEMDESNRSERFHCAADGQLKTFFKNDHMYPMDDFGAVYTSGITVFRQSEDRGYAFLDEPVYNVCAIAMAAYRNPKLENQMLAGTAAAGMRKKIENIFAIAYHQNHDCLVLSALGCGAFKNPPEHVAALFKSVIDQYAGYFRSIHFAIIDDHNTGNQLNPEGNFLPFQKKLDGLTVNPQSSKLINVASGPFRVLNQIGSDEQLDLSDVHIFEVTPCKYGALCHDLYDTQHIKSYSHPPVCPNQSSCANTDDNVHMFSFIHRTKCRRGGECDKNKDEKHAQQFEHPSFCPKGGNCDDESLQHLNAHCHPPLCPDGLKCTRYLQYDPEHRHNCRHCRQKCPHAGFCANIHDEKHLQDYGHPFPPPCPLTPFNCQLHNEFIKTNNLQTVAADIRTHCSQFSHFCPFGGQCNDMSSEAHTQIFIHIPRQMCPFQKQCNKTNNEEHLNSFSHPNIRDIRELCNYPGYQCRERYRIEHRHRYRHTKNHDFVGIVRYFALNNRTNFLRNQNEMSRILNGYFDSQNWQRPTKISSEITDWIRALEPIHRCTKVVFESILVHNHLMSRVQMNLLREPRFVTNAVVQHGHFRHIFKNINDPTLEKHARDFVQDIVSTEFDRIGPLEDPSMMMKLNVRVTMPQTIATPNNDHKYNIQMKENILKRNLDKEEIETIRSCAKAIAQASLNLCQNPKGIGHPPDKLLGTDKHVFSILGPHRGTHYGEIILIFKQELLFHPDSNFSIQAATSFNSGRAYEWRPWLKDPGKQEERIKNFHQSKLHCSFSGYELAAALQLMASTGNDNQTINFDLKSIITWWSKVDSHMVFESHLPQLIPLDYIDHVYIPRQVFDSLTSDAQQSARSIFRDALTISNETGPAYESFVYHETIKRIERNMKKASFPHGMTITIAASAFYEHILLPMTITQSYEVFSNMKSKAGFHHQPEITLIYWEAMYGDMMVTISNEPVDCNEEQANIRCLICYVAEVPLMGSPDYQESYSYLSNDHPLKHSVISRQSKFKKGSCRFYRGCNTDDYLTFCLKIEYSERRVSLSHAGPNSIYNHEVIMAEFSKGELDLSKLDFVHVSAGNGTVPVKNMIIRHEPISELHPSIDIKFKKSGATNSSTANASSDSTAAIVTPEPKKDGIVKKLVNAVRAPFFSTTLKPCPDSVNCLQREYSDHNSKYSDPCRYSELCRNIQNEPHLTHLPHKAPQCKYDRTCRELEDPVHRASYRHSSMADFLIPCHFQPNCRDEKKSKHRQMYSHGEQVPVPDNFLQEATTGFDLA